MSLCSSGFSLSFILFNAQAHFQSFKPRVAKILYSFCCKSAIFKRRKMKSITSFSLFILQSVDLQVNNQNSISKTNFSLWKEKTIFAKRNIPIFLHAVFDADFVNHIGQLEDGGQIRRKRLMRPTFFVQSETSLKGWGREWKRKICKLNPSVRSLFKNKHIQRLHFQNNRQKKVDRWQMEVFLISLWKAIKQNTSHLTNRQKWFSEIVLPKLDKKVRKHNLFVHATQLH